MFGVTPTRLKERPRCFAVSQRSGEIFVVIRQATSRQFFRSSEAGRRAPANNHGVPLWLAWPKTFSPGKKSLLPTGAGMLSDRQKPDSLYIELTRVAHDIVSGDKEIAHDGKDFFPDLICRLNEIRHRNDAHSGSECGDRAVR